jgi:hypothetical protein
MVVSLVATAKLNGLEPLAWLTDVLERLVSAGPRPTSLCSFCPGPGRRSTQRLPSVTRRRLLRASCWRLSPRAKVPLARDYSDLARLSCGKGIIAPLFVWRQ